MTQTPKFWLKVKKDYLFDNLRDVVVYLRDYPYNVNNPSEDFDSTIDAIQEAIKEIDNSLAETTLFDKITSLNNHTKSDIICLMGAAVLALHKARRPQHAEIISLINFIIRSSETMTSDTWNGLWNVACACCRQQAIETLGINWEDFINSKSSPDIVAHKLGQSTFISSVNKIPYFYEHNGLMILDQDNQLILSTINRNSYENGNWEKHVLFNTQNHFYVVTNTENTNDSTEALLNESKFIISSLEQFKDSSEVKTSEYDNSDLFPVRITRKDGNLCIGETIDPHYTSLKGEIFLKWGENNRPNQLNALSDKIKEGDIIEVSISEASDFTFELAPSLENFYQRQISNLANKSVSAISFKTDQLKKRGDIWITENGIWVTVTRDKLSKLPKDISEIYYDAIESDEPLKLQLYREPPKFDKNYNVYAQPNPDLYGGNLQKFSVIEANKTFVGDYFDYLDQRYSHMHNEAVDWQNISLKSVETLNLLLLYKSTNHKNGINSELKLLIASLISSFIVDKSTERNYILHRIQLLTQIVAFLKNKEVKPIEHIPELESLPEIKTAEETVDILSEYVNPAITGDIHTSRIKNNNHDIIADLKALVEASNKLVNVIGENELNNIKSVIARKLNAIDEFESITSDRKYYGMESRTLEFKSSIVYASTADGSSYAPEMQKWEILKTVCAFLNSEEGGELLIGVNDDGYANGLDEDIYALSKHHKITKPDLDKYRLYVQKIIDDAFMVFESPKTKPRDVVALDVRYNVEENKNEGKTILRIQVRPYLNGVVGFAASQIPEGYEKSYIRTDGRSTPLSEELRKVVSERKLKLKKLNSTADGD